MRYDNVPASRLPGPIRGPTQVNSLAKWALQQGREVARDYRTLIELEVISDNCQWIFDVAEADCPRAITALQLEWLL